MTKRLAIIGALALAMGLGACGKDKKDDGARTAPATSGTVAADGTRSVPIQVKKDGYHPDKVAVKPGEKLKLVFTRVEETECGEQIKLAGGKAVDLTMNQPVELELTAPATGEVKFMCGMDMMTGVVVVDAKS